MAAIANRNGRNMVQHVLLPVNIHFHWNLFIFEFLTIFFIFILATILKILKTKNTTLSDDLFLCQVSKGSAVRFPRTCRTNFYIGGHFEMAVILKILKTKSTTLSDDLFLFQVSKGSAVRFPRTCRTNFYIGGHFQNFKNKEHNFEWCSVTGNITAKICEVWSEFNIFCTLVTMATAAILIFFNPKICHTLRWIFLQSLMKFDERNPKLFDPPFFVSMATAAKFVDAIPILFFLAYPIPLDVDVVPIKFHQSLFGE